MIAFFFFALLPLLGAIGVYVYLYSRNRFEVEHKSRQRKALKNVITGDIFIVGPGTWYFSPWIVHHTDVDVNKEPMEANDHPALTADGKELLVSLRYNELTGRPFDATDGQPRGNTTDIDDDVVLDSVTITDFKDRTKYMADIVSGVIDRVIGEFTIDELFNTKELTDNGTDVKIPKDMCGNDNRRGFDINCMTVKNRGDVLKALGLYMQKLTNYRLRDVGFTADEIDITDLRPKSDKVQAAMDRSFELAREQTAIKSVKDVDLTDREKFSVATPEYGKVAIAESIRDLGQQLTKAVRFFTDDNK